MAIKQINETISLIAQSLKYQSYDTIISGLESFALLFQHLTEVFTENWVYLRKK